MNLLARAKLSSHFVLSFSAPSRCLFYAKPASALQQQCNFFATKAAHGSQRVQQLTKPKAQKSSEPSTTFSQRVKKQVEALAPVWPKPREIPYQAKVANFVNLIGFVKVPVQFETDSDGKHFATTVINAGNVSGGLVIPVLFEGDLAHVVACHVKKNDCVFISGQLSIQPLGLALSDGLGKFHVVAENLNFVEGYYKKIDVSLSDVGIGETGKNVDEKKIAEVVEVINDDDQQMKKAYENEKGQVSTDSVYSNFNASLNIDIQSPTKHDGGGGEMKLETDSAKSSGPPSSKKKNGEDVMNLWRDLVKNPLQWWDYREHKTKGLVKEKFPDFKQKVTGESLWIGSAPQWVLPGIKMLEFDVKEIKTQQHAPGAEGFSGLKKNTKTEDTWKSLVENPDKWWDNRLNKKNPKAPDFKHKETGEVIWLGSVPDWVLSKLPPKKDKQMSW